MFARSLGVTRTFTSRAIPVTCQRSRGFKPHFCRELGFEIWMMKPHKDRRRSSNSTCLSKSKNWQAWNLQTILNFVYVPEVKICKTHRVQVPIFTYSHIGTQSLLSSGKIFTPSCIPARVGQKEYVIFLPIPHLYFCQRPCPSVALEHVCEVHAAKSEASQFLPTPGHTEGLPRNLPKSSEPDLKCLSTRYLRQPDILHVYLIGRPQQRHGAQGWNAPGKLGKAEPPPKEHRPKSLGDFLRNHRRFRSFLKIQKWPDALHLADSKGKQQTSTSMGDSGLNTATEKQQWKLAVGEKEKPYKP